MGAFIEFLLELLVEVLDAIWDGTIGKKRREKRRKEKEERMQRLEAEYRKKQEESQNVN